MFYHGRCGWHGCAARGGRLLTCAPATAGTAPATATTGHGLLGARGRRQSTSARMAGRGAAASDGRTEARADVAEWHCCLVLQAGVTTHRVSTESKAGFTNVDVQLILRILQLA